jgi:serine/threonine protein kinase
MILEAGVKLGPYEILAPIGEGGMAEVWKARDTRLGRIVAIKKVKEQHSERFKQEARSIAALNHPYICQLHDIGPDYLVLEYVEGKPLSSPLPERETVRLATQIATALEAAHKKGIIHRDLKPSNIMVTDEGSVKRVAPMPSVTRSHLMRWFVSFSSRRFWPTGRVPFVKCSG